MAGSPIGPEGIGSGGGSGAPAGVLNDARMEAIMGRLLQVGVLLSASVVLLGGVRYLVAHASESPKDGTFIARPIQLRHPMELLPGIARGDAAAIIELGILLLVATPVCRVIFAVVGFALERDRLYVGISLAVLVVLLFGLLRAS